MYDYLPLLVLPCVVPHAPLLMAPKCKAMDKDSCAKRQKKVMMLGEKVKLLDQLARGENAAFVGRHYGVNDCR